MFKNHRSPTFGLRIYKHANLLLLAMNSSHPRLHDRHLSPPLSSSPFAHTQQLSLGVLDKARSSPWCTWDQALLTEYYCQSKQYKRDGLLIRGLPESAVWALSYAKTLRRHSRLEPILLVGTKVRTIGALRTGSSGSSTASEVLALEW